MKYSRSKLLPALLPVILVVCSCSTTPKPKVEHVDIYFVPLDGYSTNVTGQLVEYYKQRFKLEVSVLPPLPLDRREIDTDRRQAIAEEIIETMKSNYQQLLINPKAIIIGLTSMDMYIRQFNWQFAFTFRKHGRYAVVSSARMDPVNFGKPANADLMRSRLRKIVTKNIGLLYFGLAQSDNPHNVLFSQIAGVEELDAVGEDF